ncbi:ArsR/SmtB family transcription factor [Enterococcus sp.]|uniref:ArsR/SmtB family transcription factor n=1 Tax=Enterococcus sp. TaxID=35783 RepID=UPI002FCAD5D2
MIINISSDSLPVFQALSNQNRLDILLLISKNEMNIGELATQLKLSNAIVTRHVQQLEDVGIVKTRRLPGKYGLQKLVRLAVDTINIDFPQKIFPEYRLYTTEVKLGHFTDFDAKPTCGLTTATGYIGMADQPRSFLDNNRVNAELIWVGKGFLEYKVPLPLLDSDTLELLEISFEISSEFQLSNNRWPSDINYYINGEFIGMDTVSGNYSDVRGKLTPHWWPDLCSQYGELKHIRINPYDSTIDGVPVSNHNIDSLGLSNSDFFTLRIASEDTVTNVGGLTLFGEKWGNYAQNIKISTYVS